MEGKSEEERTRLAHTPVTAAVPIGESVSTGCIARWEEDVFTCRGEKEADRDGRGRREQRQQGADSHQGSLPEPRGCANQIKKRTALSKVMDAYCSKTNRDRGSLVFLFDGQRIRKDANALDMEMEEDDV